MIRTAIYTVLLSLTTIWCIAQDATSEWSKIKAVHKDLNRFTAAFSYHVYPDYTSQKVFQSGRSEVKKLDNMVHSKVLDMETLVNGNYVIILNHRLKLFMIDRYDEPDNAPAKSYEVDMSLDTLLSALIGEYGEVSDDLNSNEFRKLNEQQNVLVFNYAFGEYKKIKVIYNNNTYFIEKVVMYFRNPEMSEPGKEARPPRLEILYDKFSTDPVLKREDFSEKQFVTVSPQGRLKLANTLKDYQVINHLINPEN